MLDRPDGERTGDHLAIALHVRENMRRAAANFLYPLLTFSRKRLPIDGKSVRHEPISLEWSRFRDIALEEIREFGNPQGQPFIGRIIEREP